MVLAYNVTEIGNIISKLRQKNERLLEQMSIFELILANQQKTNSTLNPVLEKKIYNHINSEMSEASEHLFLKKKEKFLDSLPEGLRTAYYREAYQPIFSNIVFFQNLRAPTLAEFARVMQNDYYYPESLCETRLSEDILILERGRVSLTYRKLRAAMNGTPFD